MDEGKLCESQKAALNSRFAECRQITSKEKARLSLELGLRRDEIAAWFLMMQRRENSATSTGTVQASNEREDDAKQLKMELDTKLDKMKINFEDQIDTLSSQIVDLKQSYYAKACQLKKDYIEKITTRSITIPNGHQSYSTSDQENKPLELRISEEKGKEDNLTPGGRSKYENDPSKASSSVANCYQLQKCKVGANEYIKKNCVKKQNVRSNRKWIRKKSVNNSVCDNLLKTILKQAAGPGGRNTEVEPNITSNENDAEVMCNRLEVSIEVMRQADLLLTMDSRSQMGTAPPGHSNSPILQPSSLKPHSPSDKPSPLCLPSFTQEMDIKQYACSCVHCNMLFRSTHQTATEKCYKIHLRQEHGIYDAGRAN